MSLMTAAFSIAHSGPSLPQLEEPNDDLMLTEDELTWFGNDSE